MTIGTRTGRLWILALIALVCTSAATSSTSSATVSGSSSVRKYSTNVRSSRGYRFTLGITVRIPVAFRSQPGLDVGQTDIYSDPNAITFRVRNDTAGRSALVLDGSGSLSVDVVWAVPSSLGRFVLQGNGYLEAYGTYDSSVLGTVVAAPKQWVTLRPSAVIGRRLTVKDGSTARFAALTRARPLFVEILSCCGDAQNLTGTWSRGFGDNPCSGVVAVIDGRGRRLPLTKTLCQVLPLHD